MMVVVMKTSVTDLARISFREWSPNSNPKRINLQKSRFDNHMYIDTNEHHTDGYKAGFDSMIEANNRPKGANLSVSKHRSLCSPSRSLRTTFRQSHRIHSPIPPTLCKSTAHHPRRP